MTPGPGIGVNSSAKTVCWHTICLSNVKGCTFYSWISWSPVGIHSESSAFGQILKKQQK